MSLLLDDLSKYSMSKKKPGGQTVPGTETTPLLASEEGLSPTLRSISNYIDAESSEQIDTTDPVIPDIPESAKSYMREFLMFSNAAYVIELACFALITFLGFKYLFGGCVLVGGSMLGVAFTTGWLCVPQLARPFVHNPLVRWFIVTSHSSHITGLVSILAAFVVLSYFSWTNDCRSKSRAMESATISVLTLLPVSIVMFFIACYRDEHGNGGYIRWLLKLVF
jgi:nitrogen fixation-related uncharacterized protein